MGFRSLVLLGLLLCFATAGLAEFSLDADDSVGAGSPIEIRFAGEIDARDFITIVAPDHPEGSYKKYVYAKKSPVSLRAPDEPGSYVLRLMDGESGYPTLATRPIEVTEVLATVSAQPTAEMGAEVDIAVTGPFNQGDFVTVVPVGTPERTYAKYVYPKGKTSVKLRMPEEPGNYEIRYATGGSYKTIGSTAIEITGVESSVSGPSSADLGSEIPIKWTGPDNQGDFLTIIEPDAGERSYGRYVYLKENPATLRVPDDPGTWEIRYVTRGYRVLARQIIEIGGVDVTLSGDSSAPAGSEVEITWSGPANQGDYITVVAADEKDGPYNRYVYLKENPVTLKIPDEPGDYQFRYQTGQKNRVLARHDIQAVATTATVEAPETAVARQPVEISWTGPDNRGDYIAFTQLDDEQDYLGYTYTRHGSPLSVRAPKEPGRYAVHYLTGSSNLTLARDEIDIEPSNDPGFLQVVAAGGDSSGEAGPAVEIVIDASGSMLQRLDGKRRIEIARDAVSALIEDELPDGTQLALRAFGHRQPDACDTELLIPLAALNRSSAQGVVAGLEAKNLAKTPIADSLAQVPNDLAGVEGDAIVILVTDGEETCDGDPRAVIESLQSQGFNIRVNIVGFAIDEFALKADFEEWARIGGGAYFDADDADGLSGAISQALAVPFLVQDGDGSEVASGVAGGEPVELLAGDYRVLAGGSEYEVTVVQDETATVELN